MEFKFELRAHLVEPISGIEGTCVARAQYLDNYNAYLIQPALNSALKGTGSGVQSAHWVSESVLTEIPVR